MKLIAMILIVSLTLTALVFCGTMANSFTNGTLNGFIETSWEPFLLFVCTMLVLLGVMNLYKLIKHK